MIKIGAESGTPMKRIARISMDTINPCASASSAQSVFYRNPAIVDEWRYDINNEPIRTDTNSGHVEFVRVRISSLLNLLFTPAHECAPQPDVRLRPGGVNILFWREEN